MTRALTTRALMTRALMTRALTTGACPGKRKGPHNAVKALHGPLRDVVTVSGVECDPSTVEHHTVTQR